MTRLGQSKALVGQEKLKNALQFEETETVAVISSGL